MQPSRELANRGVRARRCVPGRLQVLLLCAALFWSSTAAAIDPVTLLLVRMLRDKIATAMADSAVESAVKAPDRAAMQPPPPHPGLPPAGLSEPERLRFMIDHNFTYLSAAQQDQVYQGLMTALADPANARDRDRMIEDFTSMALAVGEAQRILDKLSRTQKREIAADAASTFNQLPADQRQEFLDLLRTGQAPIPQDLNAMLLQELSAR